MSLLEEIIKELAKFDASQKKEVDELSGEEKKEIIEEVLRAIKKRKSPKKRKTKAEIERERVEALPARREGTIEDISALSKPLQDHQRRFIRAFVDGPQKGALAIHGVGSGKTLTAVGSAEYFLQKNPSSKVFVITPASLLEGFKKELFGYDPAIEKDPRYQYFTFDGYSNAVKKKNKDVDCRDAMLIIDEGQNLRTTITRKTETSVDDETGEITSTNVISSGRKVYDILQNCALKAKKILILSATPLVNKPDDIENLMAMINQHEPLDKKSWPFEKIWKNPELAQKYFGCRLSFFDPDLAMRDKFFPKSETVYVPIVMDAKTLRNYEAIENNALEKVTDDELRDSLSGAKKLESFYNGVRRASNSAGGQQSQKVNFIVEWVKGVLSQTPNANIGLTDAILKSHTDKVVIFTHFLDAGSRLISARLKADSIPFVEINGSMSKSSRAKAVEAYVKGTVKVIFISKAGAEGLNLLETGYIIITEPSWNMTEIEQIKGRGIRFKSHMNVPPEKQNVMVLMLFLIKPDEVGEKFNAIVSPASYDKLIEDRTSQRTSGLSIDLRIYALAMEKQHFIELVMKKLRAVESLENCTQSPDFFDISNIFEIKRAGGEVPPLTEWEVEFYARHDADAPGLVRITEDQRREHEYTIAKARHEMVKITRAIFGGKKDLVQKQNAFFTPPSIAADLIKFSGIGTTPNDILFLEPTAGAGFIIIEAISSNSKVFCNALENLVPLHNVLKKLPHTRVLGETNFFDLPTDRKYSVILMNPPFNLEKGMGLASRKTHDVDFVIRAWELMADEGILVCLISNKFEFRGKDAKMKADQKVFEPFRAILDENPHYIIPYESGFTSAVGAVTKEQETGVRMRMIKILKKK